MTRRLRRLHADAVGVELRSPVDDQALAVAGAIIDDVRRRGEDAVREHAERLGDLDPGQPLISTRAELEQSLDRLDRGARDLLMLTADQISRFARAQRSCVADLEVEVPGGRAGHRWLAVDTAGAYAPGGRYPLPSTVLMTVVPARVAGVAQVWVSSPRPSEMTLAAAAAAGADGLSRVGGAQAIAAMAFGAAGPRCDLVVGPGNRYVTAAKKVLFGEIGIDGLAGPSEIVVIADRSADPVLVAADLIAQAEHDADALPILIATDEPLIEEVETSLSRQLEGLPTAPVAEESLDRGYAVLTADLIEAAEVSDRIAPEHLALHVTDPETLAGRLSNYGSLFSGSATAEAFADYGVGPNHVLPTGGGARFGSGLSPLTFLRSPTWLELTDPERVVRHTADLARHEGLEGHARAAEARGESLRRAINQRGAEG